MALYTYRNGERIVLKKSPDQFVVRAMPDDLKYMDIKDMEVVSSASTRIRTNSANIEALMALSRFTAPTHHAYMMAENGQEFLITDRILVKFKRDLSTAELGKFAGDYGLAFLETYDNNAHLFQLTNHTGMNPTKLVVELMEKNKWVEKAEHDLNYRVQKAALAMPTDPEYQSQWHLHQNFNHPWFDLRSSTRCQEAWQLLDSFGSSDIVIGLTDDGCRIDHPDFSGEKFADWGYFQGSNLITKNSFGANPSSMYHMGSDHGTSSAGVAAGNVNASHTVGAAPGCRLLPIKWENTGPYLAISDSKLLTALNYMADKVDIMSNSWGISPVANWWTEVTQKVDQLARNGGRRGRGIVFLWASGNNNCPINEDTSVETPYTIGWQFNHDGSRTWVGVQSTRRFRNNLAGRPGVMQIAALASTAQRAHYSNYGKDISLTAPSNNLHTYYRLSVHGLGVTAATGSGGGTTTSFGGTSSATPLVAGIAGLVLSANPRLKAAEVISLLKQTADKDLNFDGYPKTPPATYDPNPSWDVSPVPPHNDGSFRDIGSPDGSWSPWFGYGKVNAKKAVSEALRRREGTAPPQGTAFTRVEQPELPIPDNDRNGIAAAINCTADGQVKSIKVGVDIPHSYIADLRISLVAPSGKEIMLHDRAGGSRRNLQTTFTAAEVPGLNLFAGEEAQGKWLLKIRDVAQADTGMLKAWKLELELSSQQSRFETRPALRIPDNTPQGITSAIKVDTRGELNELEIKVEITHTYIQDLTLSLIAPSGREVLLHNRSGGNTSNIIRTFTMMNTPALKVLRGETARGTWKLKMVDHAQADTGKLNAWSIRPIT